MRAAARERKRTAPPGSPEEWARGEADVLAAIAELPESDRAVARRVHELVTASAPTLVPRTFYGMPAYARDGRVICFFQAKAKFKMRYSTLGFQHAATLDDGPLWPVAFALEALTPESEARIVELVRRASS